MHKVIDAIIHIMDIRNINTNEGKSSIDTSDLDGLRTYDIPGEQSLELFVNTKVWAPYSAPDLLFTLEKKGFLKMFEDARVLDMGSGTGILGISAAKFGAKFVVMSDNSKAATDLSNVNARLNGLRNGEDYAVVKSDVFSNIPEGEKFDVIIGNLPMNPSLPNVSVNNPAFRSNQNIDDLGRAVLDEVIRKAKSYLNPGGHLFITTSSRQNYQLTQNRLNKYFGDKGTGWNVINDKGSNKVLPGEHQSLGDNPEYYNPFVEHWTNKSFLYHAFTIYNLDETGNPVYQIILHNKILRLAVDPNHSDNEGILYSRNGDGITKAYVIGSDMPQYDPLISTENINLEANPAISTALYHNYMIIHAVNY